MSNHVWNATTIVLSLVGLGVSVAANNGTAGTADKIKAPDAMQAVAVLRPTRGNKARGILTLMQTKRGVRIRGRIRGLTPGQHGFHIHEFGDVRSTDGKSAGGHFAPRHHKHGGPHSPEHHAGDLGNITADSSGSARVDILAPWLKLNAVLGRSFVVHQGEDDLMSQPSGNSGPRVALGVIGIANTSLKRAKKSAAN